MKSVSNSDLDLLRATMEELLSIDIEDPIDEVDVDILIEGEEVVDDYFKIGDS